MSIGLTETDIFESFGLYGFFIITDQEIWTVSVMSTIYWYLISTTTYPKKCTLKVGLRG